MAITRKTPINEQPPNSPSLPLPHLETTQINEETLSTTTTIGSDYEQTREQRIKENRERLQKLGIVDLSNQLKSISSTPKRTPRSQFDRKTPLKSPALDPTEPRRRSSRLQDAPPVTYVELKEDKPQRRKRDIVLEEGAKPELYTEEHANLLGNTEMPWTFFVDGYAADGTRIYDPVQGKTCHQCRQKTMGQRTHCSTCNLVQGQFCGDCLYMRYGEHVVEANQNPNWICPPCRGICNCSLCRNAKGWAPTGVLYKRISSLGYKSVAHYLIETKRAPQKEEEDTVSETQQSAKRTLPFEGMEVVPVDDSSDGNLGDAKTVIPDTEPNQTPEGVRRSGRKSKKENANAGEVVPADGSSDDKPGESKTVIPEPNQIPVGVRRSGRKSKKENASSVEVVHSDDSPDDKPGEAKTVIPDTEPNQAGVRRSGTKSKEENASAGEVLPGDDSSDDKPGEAKTVTPDTQPNQRSEGVRRSGRKSKKENASADDAVEHDPLSDKQRPEGIRRSNSSVNKENADARKDLMMNPDVAEDTSVPEKTTRGRLRKMPVIDNSDVAENVHASESLMNVDTEDVAEDMPVPEKKTRGRPRKRPMTDADVAANAHASESLMNIDTEDVPISEKKTRGRPRKRPMAEDADVDENAPVSEPAMNAETEDAPINDKKTGGRPRKMPKAENADVAKDAPASESAMNGDMEDAPASESAINADAEDALTILGIKTPEVIGSLKKNCTTGNADVVEDAVVPETFAVC